MPKPTRLTKTVRKMTSSGRDTRVDYVTSAAGGGIESAVLAAGPIV